MGDDLHIMQRAKLFAYVNNNIDIKRILQDKQFHLQFKSEQKEIIQNVLERRFNGSVTHRKEHVLRPPFLAIISPFDFHFRTFVT
jgi:hypothetical protein